jgi:predicted transcriptional regulator
VTRINQDIDDQLHTRVKLIAVRQGRPLKAVVEDALREYVDAQEAREAEAERRRRRR